MNLGVDFAAGGVVLVGEKILLVKNKKGDSSNDKQPWWGYPKGHLEEGEKPWVLMNLQTLNILRGSSEKEIIGSSGVLIIPRAKSLKPENGSISSLSFNE